MFDYLDEAERAACTSAKPPRPPTLRDFSAVFPLQPYDLVANNPPQWFESNKDGTFEDRWSSHAKGSREKACLFSIDRTRCASRAGSLVPLAGMYYALLESLVVFPEPMKFCTQFPKATVTTQNVGQTFAAYVVRTIQVFRVR